MEYAVIAVLLTPFIDMSVNQRLNFVTSSKVFLVRVHIKVLSPKGGRSVVQILVIRANIGVVIYEAVITSSVAGQLFRSWLSEWILY